MGKKKKKQKVGQQEQLHDVLVRLPRTATEKQIATNTPERWGQQHAFDDPHRGVVVRTIGQGILMYLQRQVLCNNEVLFFTRKLHEFVEAIVARRNGDRDSLLWVDHTRTTHGVKGGSAKECGVNRLKLGINWQQAHFDIHWARDSDESVFDLYVAFVDAVRGILQKIKAAKEAILGVDPVLNMLLQPENLGPDAELMLMGGLSPTCFVNLVTPSRPEFGNTNNAHVDPDCFDSLSTALSLGGTARFRLRSGANVDAKCYPGTVSHTMTAMLEHLVDECAADRESFVQFWSHPFGLGASATRLAALKKFIANNRTKLIRLRDGPLNQATVSHRDAAAAAAVDVSIATFGNSDPMGNNASGMKRLVNGNLKFLRDTLT